MELVENKMYYSMSEVCQVTNLEPHVLRFWETEFPQIKPRRREKGHRYYRRKDVEFIVELQDLLHVQRYTIEGARKRLKEENPVENVKVQAKVQVPEETEGVLAGIRSELVSLRDELKKQTVE